MFSSQGSPPVRRESQTGYYIPVLPKQALTISIRQVGHFIKDDRVNSDILVYDYAASGHTTDMLPEQAERFFEERMRRKKGSKIKKHCLVYRKFTHAYGLSWLRSDLDRHQRSRVRPLEVYVPTAVDFERTGFLLIRQSRSKESSS